MINPNAKTLSLLFFLPIFIFHHATAQNCFDADFESGTLGGYTAYHGKISSEGVVIFPNAGIDAKQHKIMKLQDGYDPIAEQFCTENKNLLVTGAGTGKYTLRLGDAVNGARTSKIVLSFVVTDDVSFFLLKYAVVISDPGHPVEVQPRFELSIKDQDGTLLDCGEYKVRAAENILGFESCEQWRVRPWTTAGFELQSYIGQTINIEIISTDCGYSGHGGYAYIDATCQPLELDLQSYCPGTGYARYVVTEGFDSYEWSTGETSRVLNIDDPIPGQEYKVTVTSSTGCTLVLTDTLPALPQLDDLEPSYFNGPDTLAICFGEEVTYQPTGTNISEVLAIELGYSSDVFYIFAEESRTINFVTSDNFGCGYDTTQLVLEVFNLDFDYDVMAPCEGDSNGEILIDNLGDSSIVTALNYGGYTSNNYFDGLPPGEHTLQATNSSVCEVTKNIIIVAKESPELQSIVVKPATCGENNGYIRATGINSSMKYSFNGGQYDSQSLWNGLSGGSYSLMYKEGDEGCAAEELINLDAYGPPIAKVMSSDSSYCGESNGFISLNVTDGYPPFKYTINGQTNDTSYFSDLASGQYFFVVADAAACLDTVISDIFVAAYVEIDSIVTASAFCEEANGSMTLVLTDESIGHSLFLDSIYYESYEINGLWGNSYLVNLIDRNGCTDSLYTDIAQIPAPSFDSIVYLDNPCAVGFVNMFVHAASYNDSLLYAQGNHFFTGRSDFKLYPGNHIIYLQDELGCIVDSMINIQTEERFLLANIFSPDDDGLNDYFCFQPEFGVETVNEFQIYDRWGNLVFDISTPTKPGPDLCWNGQYKSTSVEIGVYVYYYQVRLYDGRLLCKSGDITVKY